jgi:predicted DNA repair protein MutK
MGGGFFALLDDIAALAKVAAASLDDVAMGAAKASAKSAGVIIDDAAVTPQYVTGLNPKRELPVIWRISKGSLFNKFVIIIPLAMLLSWLAPQVLPILLICGGLYLCYEGAEKVLGWFGLHDETEVHSDPDMVVKGNSKKTEDRIVRSAVTTDLVLSTEIMLISLSNLEVDNWVMRLMMLAIIATAMTVVVYGAVAVLVKIDDLGLRYALKPKYPDWLRRIGFGMVHSMPYIFKVIGVIGTVAMLWVGGHLLIKSLHDLGFHLFYDVLHFLTQSVEGAGEFVVWLVDTVASGVFGVVAGLITVPFFIAAHSLWKRIRKNKPEKTETIEVTPEEETER